MKRRMMYKARQRFISKNGMNGLRFPPQRFKRGGMAPAYKRTNLDGCTAHERVIGETLNRNGVEALKRGWPDFMCLAGDIIFAVEVKRPGEDIRYDQHRMHEALRKLGVKVFVVHSTKEAEGVMDRMGCKSQDAPAFNMSTQPRLIKADVV